MSPERPLATVVTCDRDIASQSQIRRDTYDLVTEWVSQEDDSHLRFKARDPSSSRRVLGVGIAAARPTRATTVSRLKCIMLRSGRACQWKV